VISPKMLSHFIDGEAQAPASGRWLDDVNPATGEVHALIARGDAEDVDRAAAAAKAALHGPWSQWTAERRAELLEQIAAGIEARIDEFAEAESHDQGKPVSLARRMDIPRAIQNFRFFAAALRAESLGAHPTLGVLNYTARRPLGVVGLITPWNLPLYLLTWKTAPALAMGNTLVAKPSELTPWTASLLAEVIQAAGAPRGVFNLVHGLGAEVGQALVEHPDIVGLSFTGGTVTGRRLAATAAPMLKKLSLELGGKNATIVFADADFDQAVEGACRAAFLNQGEICLCGSRILVERPIYDRFLAALTEKVKALRVGDPADPTTDLGALISLEHRAKVEGYLRLAVEEGGTILCGGERPALPAPHDVGAFLTPALVSGLAPTCRTATEEIFGPVATIHPFDTEAEAIALNNLTRYGLSASIWTEGLRRAHRVAEALDVGLVWVNTWMLRDLRVPFGGVKDSGVGREGGAHSFEFFSEAKNICVKL
jgi:aminomuconate-semialdehyde/2-hydroxymuconate-6-semialdehyde dehydrogenase